MAVHMYLEGLGFSSIARILHVSDVAVLKWIRNMADQVKTAQNQRLPASVQTMEFDEMWHYLEKKRQNSGSGLLLIETAESLSPSSVVLVERPLVGSSGRK